jgi:tyrosine-protein kinase Etk/Wzc
MAESREIASASSDDRAPVADPSPLRGARAHDAEDELSVLDLLIVLAKRKKLVLGLPLVAAVIAAGASLLMSNIFTARAIIMPPQQQQSNAAAMLGQLGALAGVPSANLGIKNPIELYVGILNSRTIADSLIERFKLRQLYKTDTLVETEKALSRVSAINAGKNGLIVIEVDDEDPQRAANLANAYVDELDKLTQTMALTEAGQRRLFFEKQLERAKENLAGAEIALKETQEKTGLVQPNQQGLAAISAVAMLRAQIAATEVALTGMRAYATDQNPEYRRVQQQLAGLRVELSKLGRGNPSDTADMLVPAERMPELGLEYVRRFREVKYQETILELLAKQFEAAKIDEAKEAAIVQVVDRAIPPDRKSKPKRALIVILTAIAAGFAAILWAFLKEARERAEHVPAQAERLRQLRSYLKR